MSILNWLYNCCICSNTYCWSSNHYNYYCLYLYYLRKKRTQGMVAYPQPYAAIVSSNPMSYPMITQTPVTQENLLYSKPS